MENNSGKIQGLKIAYIGGGSRGWAWTLMSDLAAEEQLSGTVSLYDIDFEAAQSNEKIGNRLTANPSTKGKWKYEAVKTLKEALTGTDFVVISILPGTFREMESDVHAPEKYGIYQSVGDTVGPGGIVRSMRTLPMFMEIAENIRKYCPKAWVINYTNPMTLCVRTLYKVFPEIKAFGCCHEVFGTQKLLAQMLDDMKGIKGVARDEIKVNVLGINHFTWLDSASYQDMDLFPIYGEFVDKYYDEGYMDVERGSWLNSHFASASRVKFDLFRRYGIIAAAGDRHLAEFNPPYYLKNPETVYKWKFSLTPVSWRYKDLEDRLARSRKLISGEETLTNKKSGEEGVKQIKALLGLGEMVTNVNLPNRGQMGGVPQDCVVETNAVFSRDSIRPVLAGSLPTDVHNLVIRHVYNQETIIRGTFSKDVSLVFNAFLNDPLVSINVESARKLFGQMVKNTSAYLKYWKPLKI